jgi:hypothetical protein
MDNTFDERMNMFSAITARVIVMSANFLAQVFLWYALAVDLLHHRWGAGLWGTFGLGLIFVAVALQLQWQTMRQSEAQSLRERWLSRFLFLNIVVGGVGNVVDLGLMYILGVPLDYRDALLATVTVGSAIVLMSLAHVNALVAKIRKTTVKGASATFQRRWPQIALWYDFLLTFKFLSIRRKVIAGLSTRVDVQFATAILVFAAIAAPFAPLTLAALLVIMVTFTAGFFWLRRFTPAAETSANLGLYGLNAGVVLLLIWGAWLVAG